MSCYNLGILYEDGQGVKKDLRVAKEYFNKSCELDFQQGCDAYKKPNKKDF